MPCPSAISCRCSGVEWCQWQDVRFVAVALLSKWCPKAKMNDMLLLVCFAVCPSQPRCAMYYRCELLLLLWGPSLLPLLFRLSLFSFLSFLLSLLISVSFFQMSGVRPRGSGGGPSRIFIMFARKPCFRASTAADWTSDGHHVINNHQQEEESQQQHQQ